MLPLLLLTTGAVDYTVKNTTALCWGLVLSARAYKHKSGCSTNTGLKVWNIQHITSLGFFNARAVLSCLFSVVYSFSVCGYLFKTQLQ